MKLMLHKPLALLLAAVACLTSLFGYRAQDVDAALRSDDAVTVCEIGAGWLFDGPGERDALIFYPGALVEPIAYAPLLRRLAEAGADSFLVKMPLDLAALGINKANRVRRAYRYENWYLAGHSLGGAMAAQYAARHADDLQGLFLLGAYAATDLRNAPFPTVYIYGTQDGVVNRARLEKGIRRSPSETRIVEIEGGNHAQFGSYGAQRGDGTASVSAAAQQSAATAEILRVIRPAAAAAA